MLTDDTSGSSDGRFAALDDDDEISEWDRIRSFLHAPGAQLALIECESDEHEDIIVSKLQAQLADRVLHIFSAGDEEDFRRPLDWLDELADVECVILLRGLHRYSRAVEEARWFWTWANGQRERWYRERSKIVFLLRSAQVDDLCRYAPMLWEWIPLKFNLIRQHRAQQRLAELGADTADQEPDLELRLAGLRQQLLRARQKGIPEHLVQRDYALPLFTALTDAGYEDEAMALVESELGQGFPCQLSPFQAFMAWSRLEKLYRESGRRIELLHAKRASMFYLRRISVSLWPDMLGAMLTHVKGGWSEIRGRFDAAEAHYRGALNSYKQLGLDPLTSLSQANLADIIRQKQQLEVAEYWREKALRLKGRGERSNGIFETLEGLGDAARMAGDRERARAHFNSALPFAMQCDRDSAARLYRKLGDLANREGDQMLALTWYLRAQLLSPYSKQELPRRFYGVARVGSSWLGQRIKKALHR